MNGIYPNYVGPTVEARYTSLYPDWVGTDDVVVVVPPQRPGGGIRFPEPYFGPLPDPKKKKKDEVLLLMH